VLAAVVAPCATREASRSTSGCIATVIEESLAISAASRFDGGTHHTILAAAIEWMTNNRVQGAIRPDPTRQEEAHAFL
jgi:hypothetical protein